MKYEENKFEKSLILKNQICKLKKIYNNYYNDWITDFYEMEDLSDENDVLDMCRYETEEKIKKVVNLLNKKELKLKLIKKIK